MKCKHCGEEVEACDCCTIEFNPDDTVICVDSGDAHIHDDCMEDWMKELHSFREL